jgi:8-oxo-dGTP pyrophosphatase MutT (NUDIX family)/diadenosine tetraphosphate (Ap4A) HIT family hydrolase
MKNDGVCLFCHNLKGHIQNAKKLLPKITRSKFIISNTVNFFVTYEPFPINDDPYFLIIPKNHYNSFIQIPNDINSEINQIIKDLIEMHKKQNIIIFEHGEQEDGKKAQSIYHAHTHLILSNNNYFQQMQSELNMLNIRFNIIKFPNYSTQSVLKDLTHDQSYLLFRQNHEGVLIIETKNLPIYSQFFRVLMNNIDRQRPFVNWKNYDSNDAALIISRLSNILNSKKIEVATGILVVDGLGNVLLLKSRKEFNHWVVPGGHIEYGESYKSCAKRELLEETGLNLDKITYLQMQESLTKRLDVRSDSVSNRHFIFINCLARTSYIAPKVSLDDDKTDFVWINPNKALSQLDVNSSTQNFIRKYLQTKI